MSFHLSQGTGTGVYCSNFESLGNEALNTKTSKEATSQKKLLNNHVTFFATTTTNYDHAATKCEQTVKHNT